MISNLFLKFKMQPKKATALTMVTMLLCWAKTRPRPSHQLNYCTEQSPATKTMQAATTATTVPRFLPPQLLIHDLRVLFLALTGTMP
jgi:hypothetical protein